MDEHFFMNESAAQVRYAQLRFWHVPGVIQPQKLMLSSRDITQFKPLSSRTSVTVITGDRFDHEIPDQLNQVRGPKRRAVVRSCIKPRVTPPPTPPTPPHFTPILSAPDGGCTSKEVFGGVLPISQSHTHKRSRQANDPHAAICHRAAPEEAG